jgi:hypothetical protein
MFAFVRKYSKNCFFLLATLFCFSLLIDEIGDYNRELQDLQVVASVEYSVDDMDWNEIDDMAECQASSFQNIIKNIWNEDLLILYSSDVQRSDEQWWGLVRRYAPLKSISQITNSVFHNGTFPSGFVPLFFSK